MSSLTGQEGYQKVQEFFGFLRVDPVAGPGHISELCGREPLPFQEGQGLIRRY